MLLQHANSIKASINIEGNITDIEVFDGNDFISNCKYTIHIYDCSCSKIAGFEMVAENYWNFRSRNNYLFI